MSYLVRRGASSYQQSSYQVEGVSHVSSSIQGLIPRERLDEEAEEQYGILGNGAEEVEDYKNVLRHLKTFGILKEDSDLSSLAHYLVQNQRGLVEHAQKSEISIFYPKEATGECLSFEVTPEGRIFVHPRSKVREKVSKDGGFKTGKLSLDPFTNEMFFAQTAFCTALVWNSIQNETAYVAALKQLRLQFFVQPVSQCYFKSSKFTKEGKDLVDVKYSLITPYIEGGDLSNEMENFDLLDIAYKIARAVKELHDAGYLHLDLKPENILRDKQGEVLLCDFGNVRALNRIDGIDMNFYFAPPEWMNAKIGTPTKPSRIILEMDKGKLYDAYSFGLLLYLLYSRKTEKELPWAEYVRNLKVLDFGTLEYLEQYNKIIELKNKFNRNEGLVLNQLKGLLHPNPGSRMSIEEVVKLTSR